jgi:hypothetical protein
LRGAGSSIRVYGWFIEQLIYNQGGYVVNSENGRAKRATAVEFNGAAGQRAVKWIVDMTREGINANVEEALNAAAAKSNEAITRYNTSVGK